MEKRACCRRVRHSGKSVFSMCGLGVVLGLPRNLLSLQVFTYAYAFNICPPKSSDCINSFSSTVIFNSLESWKI